ncbi:MAG TPA: tRNA lysidine(34) synthetase TilS [Terriglobia bacterium]|nr:tRNA lysidine(34) synthetase TilS [Terriglobia bacterium]
MSRSANLYDRWSLEIRRARLFLPGERVGVAVSGGPDSILLLEFLHQFAQKEGLVLSVVHFNHHLRGADSSADDRFVSEAASRLGLPFIGGQAAVAQAAREKRQNLEATARELRYRFFFSLIHQERVDKIATAHTANDQAETVLLRLIRGSGSRGLGGIYPILAGKVVRPFLSVTRTEVEAEIERRRLAFRTDKSNLDPRFTRNRIRQELLPMIEREFNPAVIPLLSQFAERCRDDEAYLEQQAREAACPWRIRQGSEERVPIEALSRFSPAIQRRVLRQMIAAVRGNGRGVTASHVEAVRELVMRSQNGKVVELPGGLEARKELKALAISFRAAHNDHRGYSISVAPPAEAPLPELGLTLCFRVVENVIHSNGETKYNYSEVSYVDFDKLSGPLMLRNWQGGDAYTPAGRCKPHRLKELLLTRKISAARRQLWPVLLSGEEIVWVYRFPPSGKVTPSSSSRRLLQIEEKAVTDAVLHSEER